MMTSGRDMMSGKKNITNQRSDAMSKEDQFEAQKDILDVIGVLAGGSFDSPLKAEVAFIRIARLAEAGKVLYRQGDEIVRLEALNNALLERKEDVISQS